MRIRIAQLAAQFMAEHGIRDYALAKRKAARQLGAPDTHSMPGNDEIDAALRSYHALYNAEDHRLTLLAQRRQALEALRAFERFQPVLTGAVLEGTASSHADIEIEVHADASKEFEQFLINEAADFRVADRNGRHGFLVYSTPSNIHVTVLPMSSLHAHARARQEGLKRASARQLERVIEEGAA